MHGRVTTLLAWGSLLGLSQAACPYAESAPLAKRDEGEASDPLAKYKIDDSTGYMSSDVGGPMEDQASLKAGARGSTLLEDFIFRQKIQHFDHERVSTKPHNRVHSAFETSETSTSTRQDTDTALSRYPNGPSMLVA